MEKTEVSNLKPFLEEEKADFAPNQSIERRKFFLIPSFLIQMKNTWKKEGFKQVIKTYGWKAIAVFFCYYLIRDTILYILIPYLIAQGIWS